MKNKYFVLFALSLSLTSAIVSSHARRCAIDIGSGMMKMQDATIDELSGRIIYLSEPYFAKAALANHYFEYGEFKDAIQTEALTAFEDIMQECKRRNVTDLVAVATAIFRRAGESGELLLKRLIKKAREVLGDAIPVRIQIITQELESEAGFRTACALTPEYDKNNLVVLDVGNASLQIITEDKNELIFVGKPVGNATAARLFMEEIRKTQYDAKNPINPITDEESKQFYAYLHSTLQEQLLNPLFAVKLSAPTTHVIAIGGHASIFALGSKALNKITFTCEELDTVIDRYLNRDNTSDEIRKLNTREPETVVIKLMLLCSLMKALSIDSITYKQSAGNTLGILLSKKLWQ